MTALQESRLNPDNVYFHGSHSKKLSEIKKPSFKRPFYISKDIEYALAFAGKTYSSTNSERQIDAGDVGYVYPISINQNAEFFDFRALQRDFRQRMKLISILSKGVFDLICEEYRTIFNTPDMPADVWKFGKILANILYDSYAVSGDDAAERKYDVVNLADCGHSWGYKNQILANLKKLLEIRHYIDSNAEPHDAMAYIFERLSRMGYTGVITSEDDFDPATGNPVYTDYAVGIWNITGFNLVCGQALEAGRVKKIIAETDLTQMSPRQALEKIIEEYGKTNGK